MAKIKKLPSTGLNTIWILALLFSITSYGTVSYLNNNYRELGLIESAIASLISIAIVFKICTFKASLFVKKPQLDYWLDENWFIKKDSYI